MTIREIAFVFPVLNSLAQSKGLRQVGGGRRLLVDGLIDKFQPVIDSLAAKREEVIIKYGQRFGELERFRLRTKAQNDAAKAELRQFRNTDLPDLVLTNKEQDFVEVLIIHALLGGQEDFPDV